MATPPKKDPAPPAKKPPPAPTAATKAPAPTPSKAASAAATPAQPAPSKGESQMSKREVSPDAVARRAYELWLQRGGNHGDDQGDWHRAKRELSGSRRDN